uniref:Uncharacterized protein n=1 Tax=Oryza sativa subsp. japonica TaxID=39947 RepID=Q6ERZ5_ORYSJ|nr:hypothetical protein [Oryza sativa Japonica Group]
MTASGLHGRRGRRQRLASTGGADNCDDWQMRPAWAAGRWPAEGTVVRGSGVRNANSGRLVRCVVRLVRWDDDTAGVQQR